MNVAMAKTYHENREHFTIADLQGHDGQWVAFSEEGNRIVASADAIAQLSERLIVSGETLQDVVLEKIEIESADIEIGGAGLQ